MTEVAEHIAVVEDQASGIRTGLDRAIAGLTKYLAWAIFLALGITIIEVFARYVLNSPTYWAHESTTFLIAAIFLVGGPIALARDRHIRVRMIYDAVSPAKRRVLDIVNSLIALVFFGGLTYAGWIMVSNSWFAPTGELRLEGTGTSWNPPTPALLKLLVLLCVATMFVQTLLHLIAAIRRDESAPDAGEN